MKFPMNLQIFAESVETPAVAEPASVEQTEAEVVNESVEQEGVEEQEPAAPAVDENAIYAAARRAAEKQMNGLNARVASRFGKLTNPETGKSIQTVEDYFEALDAQERIATRQQMQEKGIDPNLLSQLIANDPTIRQAQQVLMDNTLREGEREMAQQLQQISEMYPEVKTLDDILKMDTFEKFDDYVRRNGLNLVEAFRLANGDKLSQKSVEATRQAAINSAKGKSHMVPTAGLTVNDGLEEIPASELPKWQAFFPEASAKELKEKYNRVRK